jgi:uncharacterized protein YbjT (DUF2867 family)
MNNTDMNTSPLSVVMLGATGAVGGEALHVLLEISQVERLTLLGRKSILGISDDRIHQHKINIFDSNSYQELLSGHEVAICTLGVGQPSKISKEEFLEIDKTAVLDFAKACKKAGIRHFELLSSVGISSTSSSFYLRTKGELVDELKALDFERCSVFQPSMILTPTNRYGVAQGVMLFLWPLLKPILFGGLRKYRGITVEILGKAIAVNILNNKTGIEMLSWDDFQTLDKANLLL